LQPVLGGLGSAPCPDPAGVTRTLPCLLLSMCVRIEETRSIPMASERCRLAWCPSQTRTASTSTSGSSSSRARRRRHGEPVCHRDGIVRRTHRRLGLVVAAGASPSSRRGRLSPWRPRPSLTSSPGSRRRRGCVAVGTASPSATGAASRIGRRSHRRP